MNNILKAENIRYRVEQSSLLSLHSEEKEILKGLSFKLEKGSILGVAGQSGSGKTTLAKIIAGILKPTDGELSFSWERDWKKTRTSPVQLLFQNNGEILNPLRVIDKIVEEALLISGTGGKELENEKEKIFGSVNFPRELRNRKGYELSGGEQQRAALARILAVKPELLILDEPFSAQDAESQLNLVNLMKSINKEFGISMICVSHDLKVLKKLCGGILLIYKGEIVEQGDIEKVFNSPSHPYTKFLLNAESYNLKLEDLQFESN